MALQPATRGGTTPTTKKTSGGVGPITGPAKVTGSNPYPTKLKPVSAQPPASRKNTGDAGWGYGSPGRSPAYPNGVGPINGPAKVNNPGGTARAVRNPVYGPNGKIIGSGTQPGKNNLPVNNNNRSPGSGNNPGRGKGRGKNIARQIALRNRRDPRQSMSLTDEELKSAAMRKLRG